MNWLALTESSFADALDRGRWFSTMTAAALAGKLTASPERCEPKEPLINP